MKQLIECVPNFSEGSDMTIIHQITAAIESVEGVRLLDVDPGKATNRTVVTFVGEPEPVVQAAFLAIKKAAELIDMSQHKGEHPRMGATDVCPLVPVSNITMEQTVEWARRLGEMVGSQLDFPVYLYEEAAMSPQRRNLADIRAGEYEGLPEKLKKPEWKPDYGSARFNARSGATVIGARDFLIAYNVNLNTTSVRRANSVAFDVREKGRTLREGDPVTGKILTDEHGEPLRSEGACKGVKGIGWFIEEYGIAQVSMNITNIRQSPLHTVFEACCQSAGKHGLRVTGSELVGLVPLSVMIDAGKFFLQKQKRSAGVSSEEIIKIAVKSLGLDELNHFDPRKKIIEYVLEDEKQSKLVRMNLRDFANETASESPAPGGGSISAYVGALGVSLGTMVANLSSHKRGWDDQWETFSEWAEKGQQIKDALLRMVDEDTRAFNAIMDAFQLPKSNDAEKAARTAAIQAATRYAIETPLAVMRLASRSFELLKAMVSTGNPNSISDGAVGALCSRAAVQGAWLNVRINVGGLKDKEFVAAALAEGQALADAADIAEKEIMEIVREKM